MVIPEFVLRPVYRAEDVKTIERRSVALESYPLYELMRRAGEAAWRCLLAHKPALEKLIVVCGSGNNAGDGLILALHAQLAGKAVTVLTIKEQPDYRGDALLAWQEVKAAGITTGTFCAENLIDHEIVVDAILGTGVKGELRPDYEQSIRSINDWRRKYKGWVLALDIPSGLDADTGTVAPVAIESDQCLSFIDLKPGMVTARAREYCPVWQVAELDIHPDSRTDVPIHAWLDDSSALCHSLPKRSPVSHKGDFGHLLLIGGDFGFGGAILMSAQAAARVGVGRMTILTRDSHVAPILSQLPEAMIRSIENPEDTFLEEMLTKVEAVVIGPGLGVSDWGRGLLERVIAADKPMLIDADGLNILASAPQKNAQWVLTPHPGEASRLLGKAVAELEANRYHSCRDLQHLYGGTVVLKGAGTLIGSEQQVTVCIEGNPGMATAGMGDILSGIIGSLLAQGYESQLAARIGVALHARAGDLAARAGGETGLLATDLLEPLRQLVND